MENTIPEISYKPTKEEKLQRQWDDKSRELRIARARAGVVKNQILRGYETLEGIRFDYISDSAFRENIVRAKKSLENALGDFLLYDPYWESRIEKHRKMTLKQYDEYLKQPITQGDQGKKA